MQQKTTLKDWSLQWLNTLQNSVAETTIAQYKHCITRYILPYFGSSLLTDISEDDIQLFYNRLANGEKALSTQTVHLTASVLHGCLSYAVNNHILAYNPADLAYVHKRTYNRGEILPDEMIRYILKKRFKNTYENFFPVLLFSALRYGECAGLSWECVDFSRNTILIRQQLTEFSSEGKTIRVIRPCLKNYKERHIKLPEQAFRYFSDQKNLQERYKAAIGDSWSNPNNLVFTNKDGTPYQHYKVTRRFKKIAVLYGMPEASIHTLRHTGCSIIFQATKDINLLRQYTGHSSDGAAAYYIHSMETLKRSQS
jgi:integrase